MGRKGVPVKTNEGTQEIKARTLGLAPRIRTALLLVDGVKSVTELERLMSAAGVTAGALQLLLDKGLIRFEEEQPKSFGATAVSIHPLLADFDISPTILTPVEAKAENVPAPAPSRADKPNERTASDFAYRQTPPASPALVMLNPRPAIVPEDARIVAPPQSPAAVAVANLIDLETILFEATKLEMKTILGVATKLELTPTQLLAPNTVVKVASTEQPRLPPLAQAEQQFRAAPGAKKHVIPAVVLRMNLVVARAHLANALDQYSEMDGYALKQKVVACESRADLEQLFSLVETALMRKINKPTVARVMEVTQSLLER